MKDDESIRFGSIALGLGLWVPTVWVRALVGDIALCSWVRHFTLTMHISTQVYNWVPANLMLGGNPAMDYVPSRGE